MEISAIRIQEPAYPKIEPANLSDKSAICLGSMQATIQDVQQPEKPEVDYHNRNQVKPQEPERQNGEYSYVFKDYAKTFLMVIESQRPRCAEYCSSCTVQDFVNQVNHMFSTNSGRRSPIDVDDPLLTSQAYKLMDEIRENVNAGVKDPTKNLKTKFTVGGVNFTYDELYQAGRILAFTSSPMSHIANRYPPGSKDGNAYLGAVVGMVGVCADKQGLNDEQKDYLHSIMMGKSKRFFDYLNSKDVYQFMGDRYESTDIRYLTPNTQKKEGYAKKLFLAMAGIISKKDAPKAYAQYASIMSDLYKEDSNYDEKLANWEIKCSIDVLKGIVNSSPNNGFDMPGLSIGGRNIAEKIYA